MLRQQYLTKLRNVSPNSIAVNTSTLYWIAKMPQWETRTKKTTKRRNAQIPEDPHCRIFHRERLISERNRSGCLSKEPGEKTHQGTESRNMRRRRSERELSRWTAPASVDWLFDISSYDEFYVIYLTYLYSSTSGIPYAPIPVTSPQTEPPHQLYESISDGNSTVTGALLTLRVQQFGI